MKLKLGNSIDVVLLIIFLAIFVFLGAGKVFDHQITHPSPTGFMASDAFTHNWVSQNLYDTGSYDRLPEYAFRNKEEYQEQADDYKLFHPPVLPFITASLAKLTGLNVYDVDIVVVYLVIVLMIVLSYFILARFSTALALFSLPLCLLFLQRKFSISLTWGWWNFMLGEFFLMATIFLILSKPFKYRYFLSAVLITAAFIAHGLEAAYAAIFIVFYLLFYLVFNKKDFLKMFLEQVKSMFLVILFSGYCVLVLFKTMGAEGYSQVRFMSNAEFLNTFYGGQPISYFVMFEDFTQFKILLIIGSLVMLYLLIKNKHEVLTYWAFVIFMSFSPYFYIMAGERGFRRRFIWPIFFSFAFGAVIFLAYSFLKSKHKKYLRIFIFALVLGTLLFMVYPLPYQGTGVIGEKEYGSYQWVHSNIDPYAKILEMYSPQNSQISSLNLLKRELFVSRPETVQALSLDNSTISLLIQTDMKIDYFCLKKDCSTFGKSNFSEYRNSGYKYYENRSVCSFDYVYMSLRNYEEVNRINVAYLQNLLDKQIFKIVFNNEGVVIAQRMREGEECETSFKS